MTRIKKIISAAAAICTVASLVPGLASAAEKKAFTDISGTEYYAQAAEALKTLEILEGYEDGSFGADKSITRAEMTAVITRMLDKEDAAENSTGATAFSDVEGSHWAAGYINFAHEHGIIEGYGDGSFGPEDNVLHEQAIKMVVCAAGFAKGGEGYPEGFLKIAKDKGITNSLKRSRGEASTRGDIAVMVYNALLCGIEPPETLPGKGVYTVGICQLVQHNALDAATQGFIDALKEQLGDRVAFDKQNASGSSKACANIVNDFVSRNVDLIMANATPALQAAAAATDTIPILGTSVTEYGAALDLEGFDGVVGGNISGTSDLAPLDKQAEMLIELFPEARNVGLLYCSAEPLSFYQVKVVKECLESAGITATEYPFPYPFSELDNVEAVTASACAASDVIYIPSDNTAAFSAEVIDSICRPAGVPVIAGEEGICAECGVATLSVSYYRLGYRTGLMAAEILTGQSDISAMPIQYDESSRKKYNRAIADELGISIPEDYEAIE